MLHEIEINRFGRISRNWRASLGRTQSQKTKRTQFDPLFSIKNQSESQIPPGRSTIGRRLNNPRTENKRPTPIGLASFRRGHASSFRTAIPARRISENVPDCPPPNGPDVT